MRDDPGGISAPTTLVFLGADSTQAAPLPHREFRLTQQPSQLLGRVPFLRLLPLDQQGEQALDSILPLLEPHTCSHFSFHFPPTERDFRCSHPNQSRDRNFSAPLNELRVRRECLP